MSAIAKQFQRFPPGVALDRLAAELQWVTNYLTHTVLFSLIHRSLRPRRAAHNLPLADINKIAPYGHTRRKGYGPVSTCCISPPFERVACFPLVSQPEPVA